MSNQAIDDGVFLGSAHIWKRNGRTMRLDSRRVAVFALLLVSIASSFIANAQGQQHSAVTKPTANKSSEGLKYEAAANRLWKLVLTKCGDSYYYFPTKLRLTDSEKLHFDDGLTEGASLSQTKQDQPPTHVWEFQDVVFRARSSFLKSSPQSPYPPQRYQWAIIWVKAWRERDIPGEWKDWEAGHNSYRDGHADISITRDEEGEWYFDGVSESALMRGNKPTCNDESEQPKRPSHGTSSAKGMPPLDHDQVMQLAHQVTATEDEQLSKIIDAAHKQYVRDNAEYLEHLNRNRA